MMVNSSLDKLIVLLCFFSISLQGNTQCEGSFGFIFDGTQILNTAENEWLGAQVPVEFHFTGNLLYSTETDGTLATDFHAHCDGASHTVVIAETADGVIFGGYNEGSWSSTPETLNTLINNFIFSVDNQTVHEVNWVLGDHITNDPLEGPHFGGGDLQFNYDLTDVGYHYLGNSYDCPFGEGSGSSSNPCNSYLSNQVEEFVADRVEIWQLNTSGAVAGPILDTDGDGVRDHLEILGCMQELACNYNPEATDSSSSLCTYPGCQDPAACNYYSAAGCPDQCFYQSVGELSALTETAVCNAFDGTEYTVQILLEGFDSEAGLAIMVYPDGNINTAPIINNPEGTYGPFDGAVIELAFDSSDELGTYKVYVLSYASSGYISPEFEEWNSYLSLQDETYSLSTYPSGGATCLDYTNEISIYHRSASESQCIFGCTDPMACNYNSEAGIEDESCRYSSDWINGELTPLTSTAFCNVYPESREILIDASGYSARQVIPLISQTTGDYLVSHLSMEDGIIHLNFDEANAIYSSPGVYQVHLLLQDLDHNNVSQEYQSWYDQIGFDTEGSSISNFYTINEEQCAYLSIPLEVVNLPSNYCQSEAFHGCTDSLATNFNPLMFIDDGSCVYSAACMGDLNNDDQVTAGDLTLFLTVFGTECD